MKYSFGALLALLIVSAGGLHKAEAQQNDQNSLLPSIDPRDIEIRGQFRARFPGLTRQPILGFDPTLRIYQVDPNRRPFMETGTDAVATLPVSELSRPGAPAFDGLNYSPPSNLYAQGGYGSYSSPEGRLWAAVPINPTSYIGGDIDYSSSDSHLDRPSRFRFFNATAEYGTRLDENTQLYVYGGGQSDFNYTAQYAPAQSDIFRKEYTGLNGGVEVRRFTSGASGWQLSADVRSFEARLDDMDNTPETNELTYRGEFAKQWALAHAGETLRFIAGGQGGSYETAINSESEQWSTVRGGVAYKRTFNYTTTLRAQAMGYYITNINDEQFYPGGEVEVASWIGERLNISGNLRARPQMQTLENLHEQNRFTGLQNDLIHTYSVDVTGAAEIKYYRGSKINLGVTYQNQTDYAYFTPATFGVSPVGASYDGYNINYDNATNMKVFAGITHQLLPETFWVSSELYLQNPELDGGQDVPFQENWGVKASTSFKPIDRLTIQGWANYTGERNVNTLNDATIDGYLLAGAEADVSITPQIGLYAKFVNIFDTEYQRWQGYQERPLQAYGGITIKL